VKQKFNDVGFDTVANSSKEFEAFLTAEIARWKTVIETGKIQPE
jgi:tripartite-type tricarboxylate transporter receptor subunit TctC